MSSNKNVGYAILNGGAAALPEKTVLVLGLGRGGTSMVAGALSKLGIYMGENLRSRYQDQVLLDCMDRNDKARAREVIQERNDRFPVWGIKKLRLWRWDGLFRQPVYVVVLRDLFAIANRRTVIYKTPLLSEMLKVQGLTCMLLLFLKLSRRPLLIASYEKTLLHPESFVRGLVQFLGLPDDPEKFADAVQLIQPSPQQYTDSPINQRTARDHQHQVGYIDQVTPAHVAGWALSREQPDPMPVELWVNGQLRANALAQHPRPDVAQADPKFHAHCGFDLPLPPDAPLRPGDKVEVRFAESGVALLNSPRVLA
jgi:hypothetical protein